jgi:peptidoglycan/LPS O-acetylase OafA/YrhL
MIGSRSARLIDADGASARGESLIQTTLTGVEHKSDPRPASHAPSAAPERSAIPFVPGLDGLRGVAVLAVMAFHAGVTWAKGGLLGVDVFFVLSGFLVTSLLVAEHAQTGTLRLRRFWARRVRRLLPALFVLLVAVCVYSRWVSSGIAPRQLRGDALSTLAYVANWHYIASGQNYFVRFGAPSPLLHTWSLAVEEQFYWVWPLVAVLVLARFGRGALGWLAGGFAALSAGLCAALYVGGASANRLYYGTDSRAQAIMIGAALALLVPMWARRPAGRAEPVPPSRRVGGRWLLSFAGWAGGGVLAVCLHSVQGNGAFLYEGGFLLVGLATATVVALVVRRPDDHLSLALSRGPLRYTGRISYGLYLYHWPLFLLLNQTRTGLHGPALLALRFAATFAAADLSARFIELPVRTRSLWAGHPSLLVRRGKRVLVPLALPGVAVALIVTVLVVTTTPGTPASAALPVAGPAARGFTPPAGVDVAHRERALLIGDSMALTLGKGLGIGAPAWGVDIDNKGVVGCDLDPRTTVNVMGTVSQAAQGCPQWRSTWPRLVAATDPDVVVVLLGRWESLDRLYDGRWTHVGEPAFDFHLQNELGEVIDIASGHGARVAFLTLPYIAQTTAQPNGSPWDMNLPSRTDAYNADLRAAAARQPGQASVVDLNQMLDPQGRYVSALNGVRVRDFDDEHISVAGGRWLQAALLPALVQLGVAHFQARARGDQAVATPPDG